MLGFIRKFIRKESVPLAHVEGNEKITRLHFVGDVEKNPNTLQDSFSLILWEIHSDAVEFFFRGKSLGWGYIGDIAGMTVNISRNVKEPPEPVAIPETPEPEGLTIAAIAARIKAIVPHMKNGPGPVVPVVIVKGKKQIREIHFEYGIMIDDAICVFGINTRYLVKPDTTVEIVMPDGTSGTGWICDETCQTITIKRSIHVKQIVRDKKGEPVLNEKGEPVETEVGINWTGRLGKRSTNDKITLLWATAVSGKEKLIFGIVLFIFGNMIGVVAHI